MTIARDKQAYAVLTCVLFLNLLLDLGAGVSIRGYWPDRVLFIGWLVFTLYIIIYYFKQKRIKIYAASLAVLTILSILPMGIIFMGIVITGFGMDASFRKELPDHYRIQHSAKSPLANGEIEIIKTYVVMERLVGKVPYVEMRDHIGTAKVEDVQSIRVLQSWRDSSRIALQFPDTTVQYTFYGK
ncbi:hypothetical protein [Chitinophaga sp.]|uniref:hypothetical protein n=1 Tax=Chitinophaga sp. TaxID=1869181 RepID=UPI0031D7DB0B